MTRLAISGVSGRMGRMLVEATLAAPDLTLAVALDAPGSPLIGHDCGTPLGRVTGVAVTADPAALAGADVLIDFTRPEATRGYLAACVAHGTHAVIGTTGLEAADKAAIAVAAERIAVVFAPNMGVGVNVMFQLLALAARSLGDGYDVEIVETHHRHKVDAPSGTALGMGEVIAAARGRRLDELAVHDRHGVTGERPAGAIGFAALRGGDVVGDHTVLFCGTGERIEITHRATSRSTYATGSLRAARFIAQRGADARGLFTMQDVLGLR